MNEFDNENRILEFLRRVPTQKVCILYNDDVSKKIYESLLLNIDNWKDNSGKTTPPPDFINEVDSIMLEVMRVNDTSSESNRRESEMQHEIEDSGILDLFPRVQVATCIPNVHNQSYDNYLNSFTSTMRSTPQK